MSGGASWWNSAYKYRWPVTFDWSGGGGGPATHDVEIIIESKWDAFWDNIQSNGYDIVPITANGQTVTFQRSGFNYANRTLTLQCDSVAVDEAEHQHIMWIYWGNATAPNSAGTVTMTTPKAGQLYLGRPTNMVVDSTANTAGGSAPLASFTKPDTQASFVWFRYADVMSQRISPYNKFNFYEGPLYVEAYVYQSGASAGPVPTMIDETKNRIVPGYIGVWVKAGADNGDYTIICNVTTTEYEVYSFRALLQVRNQYPA